jgi:hypothetical protein
MSSAWSAAEIKRLEALAGEAPFPMVVTSYLRWAERNGYPRRSYDAIWKAAHIRGMAVLPIGHYLLLSDIARILRRRTGAVWGWVERGELATVRWSTKARSFHAASRDALREFAARHPERLGGCHVDALEELLEDRDLAESIAERFPQRTWGPRPVRCIDTGFTYPTTKSAAKAYGVTNRAIPLAIAHGHRCAGRQWEWA